MAKFNYDDPKHVLVALDDAAYDSYSDDNFAATAKRLANEDLRGRMSEDEIKAAPARALRKMGIKPAASDTPAAPDAPAPEQTTAVSAIQVVDRLAALEAAHGIETSTKETVQLRQWGGDVAVERAEVSRKIDSGLTFDQAIAAVEAAKKRPVSIVLSAEVESALRSALGQNPRALAQAIEAAKINCGLERGLNYDEAVALAKASR